MVWRGCVSRLHQRAHRPATPRFSAAQGLIEDGFGRNFRKPSSFFRPTAAALARLGVPAAERCTGAQGQAGAYPCS